MFELNIFHFKELVPFPAELIKEELRRYSNAKGIAIFFIESQVIRRLS